MASPRLALARSNVPRGCFVCGTQERLVQIIDARASVCRDCAMAVGAFIAAAPNETLREVFGLPRTAPDSGDNHAPHRFEKFRRGAAALENHQAQLDLAIAYHEMGLSLDALMSAARVVASSLVSDAHLQKALWMIFREDRTNGGCFGALAYAIDRAG